MSNKNIWVAAGDGDLERVKVPNHLLSNFPMSPNAPDPSTYTPMHAAASYGHLHILEYLISKGGNVNVTDSDGDTPLYTAENVETARFLVDHGATIDLVNREGISPITHLSEDFPRVSSFLESHPSHTPASDHTTNPPAQNDSQMSQYAQNVASEQLTSNLLSSIQALAEQGVPQDQIEAEIRRLVGDTVVQGLMEGYEHSIQEGPDDLAEAGERREHPPGDDAPTSNGVNGVDKRPRVD
ncbi:ankyrin [Marasmius fiardii PR-910]|nr:ankyrin [Marasmius fiardii PR-910]